MAVQLSIISPTVTTFSQRTLVTITILASFIAVLTISYPAAYNCPNHFISQNNSFSGDFTDYMKCYEKNDKILMVGNSVMRGQFYQLTCLLQSRSNTASQACEFTGATRKLRAKQQILCPKPHTCGHNCSAETAKSQIPGRLRDKYENTSEAFLKGLGDYITCSFSVPEADIWIAFVWADYLRDFERALYSAADLFKPTYTFIEFGVRAFDELIAEGHREKFLTRLYKHCSANSTVTLHNLFIKSFNPYNGDLVVKDITKKTKAKRKLKLERRKAIRKVKEEFKVWDTNLLDALNRDLADWSHSHGFLFIDEFHLLLPGLRAIYVDPVHPNADATRAKVLCSTSALCQVRNVHFAR